MRANQGAGPMKRWMMGALVAGLVMGAADARSNAAVRKQAEVTLLATGTIDVSPDGGVAGYSLDQADKLPPVVRTLMEKAKSSWTFEPVLIDGKPVLARTKMSLRFVAKESDDGAYSVRISAADFRVAQPAEEVPTPVSMKPPTYPVEAARNGVRGTVYLLARFGRDGRVQESFVEQVNLRVVDSERGMNRWRTLLSSAVLSAAGQWTVRPPTRGEEAGEDHWTVRVPVDFVLNGEKGPAYGQWQAYIPGPRQRAPWIDPDDVEMGADALAGGGMYPIGGGVRLLTPLDGA